MANKTPKVAGFSQPAEWEKHEGCWLAWPSARDLWQDNLPSAQKEFTALCHAIGASEKLFILVNDENGKKEASEALKELDVEFYPFGFGDIWLRDTAPIFIKNREGTLASVRFGFNGWGGKYLLPYDSEVSGKINKASGIQDYVFSEILEGGSVEVDGEGTCLTTKQCLLNNNRNKNMDVTKADKFLCEALGVEKILWLGDGLLNDHTDGRDIDTLARFASPGVVLCMKPDDENDPNKVALEKIAQDLKTFKDARGRSLKVVEVISPGRVLDQNGEVMPASYMNFYISNTHVIVPVYGSKNDNAAVKAISECFPGRKTIGLSAKAILNGGGAFHCITQQKPL